MQREVDQQRREERSICRSERVPRTPGDARIVAIEHRGADRPDREEEGERDRAVRQRVVPRDPEHDGDGQRDRDRRGVADEEE